jgi:hypothetical protein
VPIAIMALIGLPASAAAVHSKLELVATSPPPVDDVRTDAAGTAAYFESSARLVPQDTDTATDVYRHAPGGFPELVSTGPSGGNAELPADLAWVSENGFRVIFETAESLVSLDADAFTSRDVYMWDHGFISLLSRSPEGGNGSIDATFVGASSDATHIFFRTWEQLVPGDEDTCFAGQPNERPCFDLYESFVHTNLISTGPNEGVAQDADVTFLDASTDGERVFFETQEALTAADADGTGTTIGPSDIYERRLGVTHFVSTSATNPNQTLNAEFGDVSEDGSRVFFRTQEQLTPDDTDGGFDVFERSSAQTIKLTAGSLNSNTGAHAKLLGITPDGSHVFFDTPEVLEPGDSDSGGDLYRRSGNQTTLISTGSLPVSEPSDFLTSSVDGQRVIFYSVGKFTTDDGDTRGDIFERRAGTTRKLSHGDLDGPFDHADFAKATRDGSRLFFYDDDGTWEYWNEQLYQLDPVGIDAISVDAGRIYARGPAGGGPYGLYRLSVDGTYPRPRGATPLLTRLVPAFEQCTSSNRTHGPPLAFGSCNPPQQASDELTVGTADSNGRPTKAEGSLRVDAVAGAPATPADEADVQLTLTITDVRRRDNLADYTGQVHPRLPLRVTDRNNTPAPAGLNQATGMDTELSFDVPCAATADTTIGSTCDATTSLEAVVPGAVTEGKRAIWELGQARVDDASGAPFMVQGLFVP